MMTLFFFFQAEDGIRDAQESRGLGDVYKRQYWNSKIIPKVTTGVVLRVRDASGTLFDGSFLNYQVSEQTRLKQITAEIFVKKGLDSAINICLLYTSDAADEEDSVDLGGRRIIKKKKKEHMI
eukprot:TRINITY_DN44262_c0_g1_i1.p1 TRINITY_DN44262_c0_g1~~TRINITY_DN44262_c0_g1_i1.p1  ORF type:complete len:123 (-),score=28.55 TRINITY_DN44262_c0_g1_i1:46-414(-)